ncbi:MMPL family transporter [Streptomyces pristinaespiralis]|uniref:Transmembrane transporter n=2 Tax=Streptomyces pristinaespiralis TaxID=38300 RepID=B5HCY9_STRE2|nr:MMPL family transporter [Streptomyces pristinaespiralis]ALC24725.1 membrane protein [Streptomyces pristinaespiralis]EDY64712.1 transmembrane transporter [Streptomyces pristinaespiralis ATCC 25486]QMU12957.1 MMPL family transporter [Streptomyces pristinaespiralis]
MRSTPRWARWLVPVTLLIVWLGIGGTLGPYAGKLGEVATNDQAAFLPRSAESTKALEAREAFDHAETVPAIVVWTTDGNRVGEAQQATATRVVGELAGRPGIVGRPSPALVSKDGAAMQAVIQLEPDLGDELPAVLDEVRAAAGDVPGATARIAGPAASQADLSDAFAGIDGLLLGVALGAVLLILLLVYRSVLLPFLIILGAVFALGLACAVVYALADRDIVRVDGQVQGILSILVIGAATDYALLLAARFREELAVREDRTAAALAAVRRSFGAITASAATVALGLLALLASDLTNNRALGPVGAIGIVCAVLSTLTFLPAVLVLLGRAAYWPARLKPSDGTAEGHGVWRRVAALVDRRPRRVWVATALVLTAFAAFSPALSSKGVPLDEIFVNDAPSVAAQESLGKHFPGGSGNPAVIIADAERAAQVTAAAEGTEGVASAGAVSASGRPGAGEPLVVDGRVRIDATLEAAADSDAAKDAIERLRENVHAVSGADALVGGYTAQQYDTQQTAARDRTVIVPVVLGIILLILVLLLRSLLVPVLLVATVALNFLATLGVATLVFDLLGFSGTDASVPLYGFVFLVALGVDYNIFLMSRVREEALTHGTRQGVLRGLATTGGVITSAGVVLAATFAALMVIPLAFLVQIAFIVAFGVLLDTLVVRSLLVPALVVDIGPRAWWPSSLAKVATVDSRAGGEAGRTA